MFPTLQHLFCSNTAKVELDEKKSARLSLSQHDPVLTTFWAIPDPRHPPRRQRRSLWHDTAAAEPALLNLTGQHLGLGR